jgi:Concanavalin A-like lectin/glucanases superfamily
MGLKFSGVSRLRARSMSMLLRVAAASALMAAGTFGPTAVTIHAASVPNTALILSTMISPGSCDPTEVGGHCTTGQSLEEQQAQILGYTTTVVTPAQWGAMTAAQFAAYQVIIIGDPTCTASTASFAAATANQSVWEPVVMSSGGNRVIIGTDPTYHNQFGAGGGFHNGGEKLEQAGIGFAGTQTGATGAYIDLSCTYTAGAANTPVPILDGLSVSGPGHFTVDSAPCAGAISIVASSGPTSGLHDTDLANWGCSVHESFRTFAPDFNVLAIATDPSLPTHPFCANDIDTHVLSCGEPYVLASGSGIVVTSEISLTPTTATNPVGTSHTVTASVLRGGSPEASKAVTFIVSAGPNVGRTGTCTTDASGTCTFTYTGTGGVGTDTITASFVSDAGGTESATATKTWTAGTTTPTPTPTPTPPTPHSLAVNGTTGYAEAPAAADLNLTSNWTVEAWFKDEDPHGFNHDYRQIVAKGDRNANPEAPYYILIGQNNLIAGVRTGGTDYPISWNLVYLGLDPKLWHHVAVTFTASGNILNLWLDGKHIAYLGVPAHSTTGNTLPLEIGRGGPATAKYWLGKIDDLRVWNIARSGTDITATFGSEFTGTPPTGLVANWQFDESGGSTASDSAGSHTATLNGGASFSTDVHP